jgi:hypothetical protein
LSQRLTPPARTNPPSSAENRAIDLVRQVCTIAGDRSFVEDARAEFATNGVATAVQRHDDGPVFDWLVEAFNLQGISDHAARAYWIRGGGVTHFQVTLGLARGRCPKLGSFGNFNRCRYRKEARSCAEPDYLIDCPLPRHDLRNGRLNQMAYSLRLFLRDVCSDDFVGWIDQQLSDADHPPSEDRVYRLGRAVIDPMKGVFGVSDKVLSMALSELLIGADTSRPRWVAAGAGMIAIDTLVHNWLHRTGLLASLDAQHNYGVGCYGPRGCAALLREISGRIDARQFNPDSPPDFPRFVQFAIWRFCALDHDGRCNGVRIDDRRGCEDADCPLGPCCARIPLGVNRNRPRTVTANP